MVAQSSRHLQPAAVQLLWTFFQPAGPMLLMLVLYAQALAFFEQHHIPHDECYADSDRRFLATSRDLFSLARVLVCFAAACLAASAALCAAGGQAATAAAILVPPLMYSTAAALMLLPVNALRRPSRVFFCRTLGRVLIPSRPVSWADFLLADILTSLAKSSSDLSRSTCLILHGEAAATRSGCCCVHSTGPAAHPSGSTERSASTGKLGLKQPAPAAQARSLASATLLRTARRPARPPHAPRVSCSRRDLWAPDSGVAVSPGAALLPAHGAVRGCLARRRPRRSAVQRAQVCFLPARPHADADGTRASRAQVRQCTPHVCCCWLLLFWGFAACVHMRVWAQARVISPCVALKLTCMLCVLCCAVCWRRLKFPLRRMWLGVMVLNSTYSFYWDVEQDWDLPWLMQYGEQGVLCVGPTCAGCSQIRLNREHARVTSMHDALTRKCRQKSALSVLPLLLLLLPTGGRKLFGFLPLPGLKGSHLYSPRWYAWLLASNLVLRFSWAHRLLGDLEAHSSVLMVVALFEVVRRWQWLFVRVETELRKLRALQLLPKDSDEHMALE